MDSWIGSLFSCVGFFLMAIASERGKLIFRKTERELSRLSSEQGAETVHRFRTTVRRLETLLEELLGARDRNQKKLLKILKRIRKNAGRVRDIDVQLSALRSMKVPLEPRRKTQLTQELLELRAKHETKLGKLLKKHDLRELEKRLKRAAKDVSFDSCREPLSVAKEILAAVPMSSNARDEASMHRFRIAVKRARYAAEFAPISAESKHFIAQLKHMQDALGHWHDWFTLTNIAADRLGGVTQSSLVAILHNVTRAKFRQAVAAVSASQIGAKIPATASPKASARPLRLLQRAGAAA